MANLTYCRDSWENNITLEHFQLFACAKCFIQVFFGQKPLTIDFPLVYPYELYDSQQPNVTYAPEPDLTSSVGICAEVLDESECAKWQLCCEKASECCAKTQQIPSNTTGNCPPTWDGITCWAATPGGTSAHQECPTYYVGEHFQWLSPSVEKHCEESGVWRTHPEYGLEVSDYEPCFDAETNLKVLKVSLCIDIAGNAISSIMLVAAIVTILSIRQLRKDLRERTGLKIHFNLFFAVLFNSVFSIAFDFIYMNIVVSDNPLYLQNAVWCRTLHALTKYFKATTYMGMFCEGWYLLRRISHVMKMGLRDRLWKYIVITWCIPCVTVGLYCILRIVLQKNEKCWIDDGIIYLEFIYILPNVLSLLCNLIFLVSIEVMLCTKMRSDTNDRRMEVLRHAVRATLALVPIFGLQFLFIIYRPKHWPPFEVIAALLTSTQGTMVALLYCFTTKQVIYELGTKFPSCRRQQDTRQMSLVSTTTTSFPTSNSQRRRRGCLSRMRQLLRRTPTSNGVPVYDDDDNNRRDSSVRDVYLEPTRRMGRSMSVLTQKSSVHANYTSMQDLFENPSDGSPRDRRAASPTKGSLEHLPRRSSCAPERSRGSFGFLKPNSKWIELYGDPARRHSTPHLKGSSSDLPSFKLGESPPDGATGAATNTPPAKRPSVHWENDSRSDESLERRLMERMMARRPNVIKVEVEPQEDATGDSLDCQETSFIKLSSSPANDISADVSEQQRLLQAPMSNTESPTPSPH